MQYLPEIVIMLIGVFLGWLLADLSRISSLLDSPEIVIMLISVFLGWLLADPSRIPSSLALYRRTSLKGDWHCHWQSKFDDDTHWTKDHVRLTRPLGKLRIRVITSSEDFDWDAKLIIKHGTFCIGTWETKRPDGNALGTLWLKFDPQGTALVGYWTGPAKVDRIMSGYVIVAPTEYAVEDAKRDIPKLL